MASLFFLIFIVLCVIGFLVYLLRFAPIDETIKQILRAVLIFGVFIWVIIKLWGARGALGIG